VLSRDLLPCTALYDNIIYRYKYATDAVNAGVQFLNTGTEETENSRTGDLIEHKGFFFRKVAYSSQRRTILRWESNHESRIGKDVQRRP
jgi:hypothetical protein